MITIIHMNRKAHHQFLHTFRQDAHVPRRSGVVEDRVLQILVESHARRNVEYHGHPIDQHLPVSGEQTQALDSYVPDDGNEFIETRRLFSS